MTRFLTVSGAAILAMVLAAELPALLRALPPAVSALVAAPGERDPCLDGRSGAPPGCAVPLAWLEDGWALLSDWPPGHAELRADGRRGKPATRRL